MLRIGSLTAARNTRAVFNIVALYGLTLLISLSFLSSASASGLGVSPSEITVNNAFRGVEYRRTIRVFNTMENATSFLLSATGDISSWIHFYHRQGSTTPITNVTVPGNSNAEVFVAFRIPEDAANANYSSAIYVQTYPSKVANGTAVIISARVNVRVTVTGTQILTGIVRSMQTMDTEVNYPLRIKVDFQNTGNVVARPEVRATITKGGHTIHSFTFSRVSVNPDLRRIISVEWNTTGKEPGDYTVGVTVSLGQNILLEKNLTFKLFPLGTLTRKGELLSISTTEKILHSKFIKILATFKNTGLIDTFAKFVGEVYKEGNLVDVIESEITLVEVGSEEAIISYLKLKEDGNYIIKGYVVYDGKKTEIKEMRIEVKTMDQPTSNPLFSPQTIGLLAVIIGVLTAATIKMKNARGKRSSKKKRAIEKNGTSMFLKIDTERFT